MNNEERILTMLENMQTDIFDLKDSINVLKQDMAHHNHYVEPLIKTICDSIQDLPEQKKRIDRIEVKQEDHGHRILALEQVAAK